MKNILKKCLPVLAALPFFLGVAGYLIAGNRLTDALYGSLTLYAMSPTTEGFNLLIELARWLAPLVTATTVLYALRQIWNNILDWFKVRGKDSVAVYTDTEDIIAFGPGTTAIYPGTVCKKRAKSHIILFSRDLDSLKFYESNKAVLAGKQVYIGLQELDLGLLEDDGAVNLYDINGAIARLFWKQAAIWRKGREELTVTIYGSTPLAQNLLNSGLLLNLYSTTQRICYHLISADSQYALRHGKLKTANADTVCYHTPDDPAAWDAVRGSDMVILAEETAPELLQTVGILCKDGDIYYYSPAAGDMGDYLHLPRLHPFGRKEEILTDDNIRRGKLIEKAIAMNRQYAEAYNGEADWRKLNGFLKWSNISSADYNEVMAQLIREGINPDLEQLSELEHIRWCRFHYINYWSYGVPENGKNKDAAKKIHSCLKPYAELSEEEKDKDRAVVRKAVQ